jgi:hypothetical protein
VHDKCICGRLRLFALQRFGARPSWGFRITVGWVAGPALETQGTGRAARMDSTGAWTRCTSPIGRRGGVSKGPEQAALWRSMAPLAEHFFEEAVHSPVPVDLRALKAAQAFEDLRAEASGTEASQSV